MQTRCLFHVSVAFMWSYRHKDFSVHQIAALQDNYIYLIEAHNSEALIAVDPTEAAPVQAACEQLQKRLTHVFNTHHHRDHTDGNLALKDQYSCLVVGAAIDAERIPGIDIPASESSPPEIEGLVVQVLDVPGHTSGHIAFVIWDALFCGDTLFGAGCGRIFEGTPEQMWTSLEKISRLAGQTRVYCAHEYTLANLNFARLVDAGNRELETRTRLDKKHACRKNRPFLPQSAWKRAPTLFCVP